MIYIARFPGNKLTTVDARDPDTAVAEIVRAANAGATLYRVQPQGDGTFLLIPQRAVPGSATFKQVLESVQVEDDV